MKRERTPMIYADVSATWEVTIEENDAATRERAMALHREPRPGAQRGEGWNEILAARSRPFACTIRDATRVGIAMRGAASRGVAAQYAARAMIEGHTVGDDVNDPRVPAEWKPKERA